MVKKFRSDQATQASTAILRAQDMAIQPPQQGFVLPPLFTAQCLQYQALEHPYQSPAFPGVPSLEPPTTNNQPGLSPTKLTHWTC